MSNRQDAARAASRPPWQATATGAATGTAAGRPRRAAGGEKAPARAGAGDPEQDLQSRDGEPDPHEVARQIVLRQLAMAPRSRKQLARRLRQRGCPDEVAETVLDRMTEVGLVDDEAYAAMLVRSQQSGRGLAARTRPGCGPRGSTLRRQRRPWPTSTRRRSVSAPAPWSTRSLRTMHGLDATVQTRRLAGMLARKGYPSSVAFAVIREAIAEAPEHQRD